MKPARPLRRYFNQVVHLPQVVILGGALSLVVLGYGFSLELFMAQLARQSDEIAWNMDHFVDDNLDLLASLALLVDGETNLDRVLAQHDFFQRIFIIGPDRRLLRMAPADARFVAGMDMSGRYFQESGQGKHFGRFYFSPEAGVPALESSTPLASGGWLNIEISLEHLQEQITHFGLGSQGKAYICDDHRRFLAHPEYHRVQTQEYLDPAIDIHQAMQGQLLGIGGSLLLVHVTRLTDLQAWLVVEVDLLDLVLPYLLAMAGVLFLLAAGNFFFILVQRYRVERDLLLPVKGLEGLGQMVAAGQTVPADPSLPDSRILEIRNLNDGFLFMLRRLRAQRESLEQTLANLEARNREMQSFTHAVSHDLRSPLITIQGFLAFLPQAYQNRDEAAFQADLERINSAAATMEAHLQDILSLSRIGRVAALPTMESLSDCAREAAGLLEAVWQTAGTRPVIADDLPVLAVHRHQLVEVFQNLFENACKYRSASRPLEVVLRRGEDDWIELADNGRGFDPAHAERIFTLFERLDHSVPGSGLGLAVVRRIIQTHQGEIHAWSAGPDQGAVFRFRLAGLGPLDQAPQGGQALPPGPKGERP